MKDCIMYIDIPKEYLNLTKLKNKENILKNQILNNLIKHQESTNEVMALRIVNIEQHISTSFPRKEKQFKVYIGYDTIDFKNIQDLDGLYEHNSEIIDKEIFKIND